MGDGLYLHIPFCSHKCSYCNFVSGVYPEETKLAYAAALCREMALRRTEIGDLDTVYFGGGTPGRLSIETLRQVFDGIRRHWSILPEAEITFETNPDTITEAYAQALAALGVNRVSLGLQTANDELLKKVGRWQTCRDFETAVSRLTAVGITNLSVDIMLGLPDQTVADVEETVRYVMGQPVRHVSAYGLKVERGTPLESFKTDDDVEADFYALTVNMLAESGFRRYETSNFALKGYECRHNLKYWRLKPYLGLGVSAHSDTLGFRSANTSDLTSYIQGQLPTRRKISETEREEEYLMLSLRLEDGFELADFRRRFGRDFWLGRETATDQLISAGCLLSDNGQVRIAPAFAYVADQIVLRLL